MRWVDRPGSAGSLQKARTGIGCARPGHAASTSL